MKTETISVSEKLPVWAEEAIGRFRAQLEGERRSPGTVRKYISCLGRFLAWFGKPPEVVTRKDLQGYKEHLGRETELCENSIVVEIAALNSFFANVMERYDLRVKAPKRVHRPRFGLTREEIERILAEAKKNPMHHALLCTLYYSAGRANEICSLELEDFDRKAKQLRFKRGKGGDARVVNLSDEAVSAMATYVDRFRPMLPGASEKTHLFLKTLGGRVRRNDLWETVKKCAFEAGIEKDVFPHLFRHSMITHMAEAGLTIPEIQAQSGHKSSDQLMGYVHISPGVARGAYDKAINGHAPKQEPDLAQESSLSEDSPQKTKSSLDRLIDLAEGLAEAGKLDGKTLDKLVSKLGGIEKNIDLM